MKLTAEQKDELKRELVSCLQGEEEIRKIVVFGSFVYADDPHDLDVAVFQESERGYIALALKYRRMTRPVARKIPIDIFPIRAKPSGESFLYEVERGVTVYEK